MAYQLPTGYSYVGAKPAVTAPGATTNPYGFAPGSLNFQPASDFAKAPAAPVTPVAAMPVEYTMPIQQTPAPAPVVTTPPAAPTLPPGFSFKTPVAPAPVVTPPAPVVQPPVAKPVTPPASGPVTPPPVVKAPVVTPPKPVLVDPRVAALKNQGYTDAQITAAGGAPALLAKVNAPRTPSSTTSAKATDAVNYNWADLNKAVTALQKANPRFAVQGMPVTSWSTAGVASLAKTDPAIFKALQSYLPKY